MSPLAQELDEAASKSRPARADHLLELARRAGEEQLAVGEHDDAVGVALGLLHVVGRVDDGRARPASPGMNSQSRSRWRGSSAAWARPAAAPRARRAGRWRCSPAAGYRRRDARPGRPRDRRDRSGRASGPPRRRRRRSARAARRGAGSRPRSACRRARPAAGPSRSRRRRLTSPSSGRLDAGEDREQRGLAGAVRADDGDELAGAVRPTRDIAQRLARPRSA